MILLLVIYLLFEIGYDHWATGTDTGKVIYFTFQWGWVAFVALNQMRKSDKYKLAYLLFAAVFVGLSVNEMLCFDLTTLEYNEAVNDDIPVFGLTILSFALFTIHEIIQWKQRKKGLV